MEEFKSIQYKFGTARHAAVKTNRAQGFREANINFPSNELQVSSDDREIGPGSVSQGLIRKQELHQSF